MGNCCKSREGEAPAPGMYYRVSTSLKAMRALYTLPQDKVETFLQSYTIFEQERITGEGNDQSKIVNYYEVLNHLCAVGEVEKMYIPPVIDPKVGIFANQVLFEKKMAEDIGAKQGFTILDMGCGRGRIAHHMASMSGAKVIGINIDKNQLATAREYAQLTGLLGKQLEFKEHNYNEPLPFDDETFDAMYQVQVCTYAKDLDALCRELFRVLKPGAKMSFLDWVKLDAFNPKDPHHADLLARVKPLIGAVSTPSPKDYCDAMSRAGFMIVLNKDASVNGHQYPLIEFAERYFEHLLQPLIMFLCRIRVLPRHLGLLFERFTRDGRSFVEADKMGLFTTSWQIVAQKPATTKAAAKTAPKAAAKAAATAEPEAAA